LATCILVIAGQQKGVEAAVVDVAAAAAVLTVVEPSRIGSLTALAPLVPVLLVQNAGRVVPLDFVSGAASLDFDNQFDAHPSDGRLHAPDCPACAAVVLCGHAARQTLNGTGGAMAAFRPGQ